MSDDSTRNDWFVGASRGGTEDMTDQLVREGIWRYWPGPKGNSPFADKIRAMKPGDRIAIKSAYVKKHDLPFDNRGNSVSVMAIKAIGEITENLGDGLRVRVDWKQRFDPPREWFFYTARFSVWKMKKNSWAAKELSRFAFEEESQDIERFLRDPYWASRYGAATATDSRFGWAGFYQALADHLRAFRDDRSQLVAGLEKLADSTPHLNYIYDPAPAGGQQFVPDIDPFTVMGTFNRNLGLENRRRLAASIADLVGLDMEVPEAFDGVPVLNMLRAKFFFRPDGGGKPEHIDTLWEIFTTALDWTEAEDNTELSGRLASLYTRALGQPGIAWMMSMGLFWIRPWDFLPLDRNTRSYLKQHFQIDIPRHTSSSRLDGKGYLELIETLKERMESDESAVASFPELSYSARHETTTEAVQETGAEDYEMEPDAIGDHPAYGAADIEADGCFFDTEFVQATLQRLKQRRNLILQGPPGTGKTWLAKRLAFAWIGRRAENQITAVQFHPTLSYEDFVRGWRPSGKGELALADGPLMQVIHRAKENPNEKFVLVIEEINRGNPAQIFGEMLTLLEGDKRHAEYALRLSHMADDEPPIFVPLNLYLIGTMNIADRSLALVDLALRRRFAFIDLKPQFNKRWKRWMMQEAGMSQDFVESIQTKVRALNETIADDSALGPQFCLGHSYLTRPPGEKHGDDAEWFQAVVKTEIRPLLEEYWFDRPELAHKETERLLVGL